MYKENLFELIRKEEVIIWAGAGMSLYAGYPSGKKFGEILVEALTPQERERINVNLPLPDLAEEFYRVKGNNKNSLIQLLNKTFKKKAEYKGAHDQLALIPHFKTIITTNYDNLFEDSYGNNAQTIYKTAQIPYIDNKKIQVFKVHGDLDEPDSIILTKSDYNNFFKEDNDNGTYWSVIKERLATNAVLFLGYNLEDPNVSVVFDRITDSLGDNRKERFLVAPNLPEHKRINLIKNGVNYIDSTAEQIVDDLLSHLKENIISDIENGVTSADTFRQFLANVNLLPDLRSNKGFYQVTSLRGINDEIDGKAKFTFKNEGNFIKEFEDFIQGRKFGKFVIPQDKLIDVNFSYGGVKFPDSDGIFKLELTSTPRIELIIDIRFEDGFEFNKIPVKLYSSESLIEVHLQLDNAEILVKLAPNKGSEIKGVFSYTHKEICKSVKAEIEFFSFLERLVQGSLFTVYSESKELIQKAFPESTELLEEARFLLDYFKSLQKIEISYSVRFSNIDVNDINDESYKKVLYITSLIENEYLDLDWEEELLMTLADNYSDEVVQKFEEVNKVNAPVVLQERTNKVVLLHDKPINLGYKKVEFQDVYVLNLKEIVNRNENVVRMKSRTNKIHVSFTKSLID